MGKNCIILITTLFFCPLINYCVKESGDSLQGAEVSWPLWRKKKKADNRKQ